MRSSVSSCPAARPSRAGRGAPRPAAPRRPAPPPCLQAGQGRAGQLIKMIKGRGRCPSAQQLAMPCHAMHSSTAWASGAPAPARIQRPSGHTASGLSCATTGTAAARQAAGQAHKSAKSAVKSVSLSQHPAGPAVTDMKTLATTGPQQPPHSLDWYASQMSSSRRSRCGARSNQRVPPDACTCVGGRRSAPALLPARGAAAACSWCLR